MIRTIKTSVGKDEWFRDAGLQRIMTLLNRDHGEARVVGGAVRNALMDMPVKDIDIATTLTPAEVVERAEAASMKTVPTGIDHGTVTLVIAGRGYEVTTLRADVETDGRRATVAFGTDWQVDAERRDLTINALYARADGEIVDLVGGFEDIEKGVIRFIGDPAARIAEDYLRVLRFFRFFAWYGSGRPDAEGLKACAAAKDKLSGLSAERIWSETKKLLGAPDPGRALLWMRQTGVLTAVLPETEKWGIDAVPGIIQMEKAFRFEPDPLLRLAGMIPPDSDRIAALAGTAPAFAGGRGAADGMEQGPGCRLRHEGRGLRASSLRQRRSGRRRPAQAPARRRAVARHHRFEGDGGGGGVFPNDRPCGAMEAPGLPAERDGPHGCGRPERARRRRNPAPAGKGMGREQFPPRPGGALVASRRIHGLTPPPALRRRRLRLRRPSTCRRVCAA